MFLFSFFLKFAQIKRQHNNEKKHLLFFLKKKGIQKNIAIASKNFKAAKKYYYLHKNNKKT